MSYEFQGKKTRWDFWEDGVSSSGIGLWLNCREQFRQEVVNGWRTRESKFYFAYGTCIHWVFQKVYSSQKIPSMKGVRKLISLYENAWLAEVPRPTQKQLEQQETIYGMAEAVLPSYFKRWEGDFPGGKYPIRNRTETPHKWIQLETRFDMPYTFSDGKTVRIRGTRDGLFKNKTGGLYGFDTKNRSIIIEDDIFELLPLDFQQMLYLWTYWKETGRCPLGTVMNITRRPGQRRGKDEPLKDFLERIRKDVSDPKRWDHYFMRFQLDTTEAELREWGKTQLIPVLKDMRAWWEGEAPHYMNPNALVSKYGRCDMFLPILKNYYGNCYQRAKGKVMDYQTEAS